MNDRATLPLGKRPSLRFVEGVNFELTYACNLSCPHCLQADSRACGDTAWADPEPIRRAMLEAFRLGLTRAGINLTGGEILRAGSPLPKLLETTYAMGVPVRINTNGWWGEARRFQVGSQRFNTSEELIGWLQTMGVAVLALSVDERYERYPALWRHNVAIIRHCERLQQPYELVCTGLSPGEIDAVIQTLTREVGTELRLMAISAMERVDIGDAAGTIEQVPIADIGPLERLQQTDCALCGFYRPFFLHVAPDGGVRSCLYAVGNGWLGNIRTQTLREIVEGFETNPVVRFFSGVRFDTAVKQMAADADDARFPRHPCGFAAALARRVSDRQA